MCTIGQVRVRVMPDTAWIWATTSRPRSSTLAASARTITSFALDGSAQILHGIVAGLDLAAILFKDAHVGNLDALVGGVVAFLQLSPLLHAGLALHANAGLGLFPSGAIGLKTVVRVHLLDDKRFLRILGSFRFGLKRVRRFFCSSSRGRFIGFLRLSRCDGSLGRRRGTCGRRRLLGTRAGRQQTRRKKSEETITHKLS